MTSASLESQAAERSRALAALSRILNFGLVGGSVWFAGCVLWVVWHRFGSPLENEWLEGDEFHHALRILTGEAWYPAPSLDFFPGYYPPGFPLVCAAAMRLFGESLPTMRGVSVASTAVVVASLFFIVRRRGDSNAAVISVGLFLGAFVVCGAWFDIARVDMLALATVLGSIALLERYRDGPLRWLAMGLLTVSCLVKQTNVAFLAAVLLLEISRAPRKGVLVAAVSAAALAVCIWLLQRSSGGWFAFYTWTMPASATLVPAKRIGFWTTDMPDMVGPALLVALAGVGGALQRRASDSLGILLLPMAIVASWSARTTSGGYDNDLLYAMAFLSIAVGVGLHDIGSNVRWAPWLPVAQILTALQMMGLRYDVTGLYRTPAEMTAGLAAVERLRALPEPVLAPYHPYVLHLAGHPMHMHFHKVNEVGDIVHWDPNLDRTGVLASVLTDLAAHHWVTFVSSDISSNPAHTWIDEQAGRFYMPVASLFSPNDGKALFPTTGNPIRPSLIWLPVKR